MLHFLYLLLKCNIYKKGNFHSKVFLFLSKARVNKDEKFNVLMGDSISISCGTASSFCTLHNPNGTEITSGKNCLHVISTVGVDDVGKWKCFEANSQSMQTHKRIIEIIKLGKNEKQIKIYISFKAPFCTNFVFYIFNNILTV